MRGIIFTPELVPVLLERGEIVTRRIVKPQPTPCGDKGWFQYRSGRGRGKATWHADTWQRAHGSAPIEEWCAYQEGDRLYLKETWGAIWTDLDPVPTRECNIVYRADTPNEPYPGDWPADEARGNPEAPKWKSSLFMPEWASRATLEVTSVGVQRVQDMTEADAEAAGMKPGQAGNVVNYALLWDGLNAKRGYPWASNPWVWVIGLRVVTA